MVWGYALMCLIYGTTFLAIRAGDDAGMPPFVFAGMRFGIAGVITLLVILLRNRSAFPTQKNIYYRLLSVGFFNTTAVFAIVYLVEKYVPSGYAALMSATMPFMVMLLGRIRNKHTITLVQSLGLIMGFVGVAAIAWPGLNAGIPHWIASTAALLVAQITAAIGAIQSRSILEEGVSPFIVNGFQVLFGSIGLFILAGLTGGLSLRHVHAWGTGVTALLYLTVFGSIVASTLYFWLVKRTGALIASTWTYVSPVIAVFVGYLWFKEPVYALTIVGTVVILGGVFLLNMRAFKEVYRVRSGLRASSSGTGMHQRAGR